jgi:hypothetical protein
MACRQLWVMDFCIDSSLLLPYRSPRPLFKVLRHPSAALRTNSLKTPLESITGTLIIDHKQNNFNKTFSIFC